jgi:hypothetical protein
MKFICLAVALCLVASAVADFDYAGSTAVGTRWSAPTLSSATSGAPLTCAVSSPAKNTTYQAFNVTFTAPTYIRILGLFEKDFRAGAQVIVYDATNFAPQTAQCAGFLFGILAASSGLAIDAPVYVPVPGTYTVVVTASVDNAAGLFAINALVADSTGNTRNASRTWNPISSSDVTTDCTDTSSNVVNYNTFTWTQNTTGVYDIEVFFSNMTVTSFYGNIAVFNGTFPNGTNPNGLANACTNGSFIWGTYGNSDGSAIIPSAPLNAGWVYTVAVSGYSSDEVGDYGIFVRPTRYGNTSASTASFLAPEVPARGTASNCTQGTDLKYYQNVVFTAVQPVYIMDTGSDSSFDTAVFLYEGVYAPNGAAPSNCSGFIYAGDTGDGGPIAVVLTVGNNYTAVVSSYSTSRGTFSLYALTGTPLGLPVTTTTGSMTGAATTGDGSSATTAVASMLLVVVAAVFAMF